MNGVTATATQSDVHVGCDSVATRIEGESGRIPNLSEPAAAAIPSGPVHLPVLDGIRGIAILMVMIYHFSDPHLGGGVVVKLLKAGVCGVDLFFVLSGFLITGILFDSRDNQRYFRDFYIRRALRIFPLYYGVLIGVLIVLPWFNAYIASQAAYEHQSWLWLYLSNYLRFEHEATSLGCLSHFWSLAVEEQFYFIWPLAIYFCNRKTGLLMCVGCVLLSIGFRTTQVIVDTPEMAHQACNIWTQCRMEALAVGAFVALFARGGTSKSTVVRLSGILGIAAVLSLGYLTYTGQVSELMQGGLDVMRYTLCAWIAGALVALSVASNSAWVNRVIGCRPLRFFGKYSYGLYVFHWILIPAFRQILPSATLLAWVKSPLLAQFLLISVSTGISVVVALLSWHLFEKHFLRLKDVLAPRPVS